MPSIAVLALVAGCAVLSSRASQTKTRWWKGNTHTHTYWSDGNAAPQVVVSWYREHGYQFLVLSEHDRFPIGERWYAVSESDEGPLTAQKLADLRTEYGDAAITTRERDGRREMRLWELDELRRRFETPGRFLLVPGEEITAAFGFVPVHVTGVNLREPIAPIDGSGLLQTIRANIEAVTEQQRSTGTPMIAQLNHPNYKWALTAHDVAQSPARFFEVFNGHPSTQSAGDATHPSTEEMWDTALAERLEAQPRGPLLFGVASDDAHDYPEGSADGSIGATPGRGWIAVRAEHLDGDEIARAMERGDFYASSGVTLSDVAFDGREYTVTIEAQPNVTYTTRFVGTRASGGRAGSVLAETTQNPARYRVRGDELYVRATIVSTKPHAHPPVAWDFERAWTQPVRVNISAAETR